MFFFLLAKLLARPAIVDWLIARAMRTPFSHIRGADGSVYMFRYWLFNAYGESSENRSRWQFPISVRLHHIMRPDGDRHMHDHPWNARTIILRGFYDEVRLVKLEFDGMDVSDEVDFRRMPGSAAKLQFGEYHRITSVSEGGVWTLFISGRHRGTWGFLVDGKKIHWRRYLGME